MGRESIEKLYQKSRKGTENCSQNGSKSHPQFVKKSKMETCIETFGMTLKKINLEKETTFRIEQEINTERVSTNYAKRVEKGPKMEPKWVQKS